MAEKSNDGTVAMHFGEIEDTEFMAVEDYLQTLPNAVGFVLLQLFLLSENFRLSVWLPFFFFFFFKFLKCPSQCVNEVIHNVNIQ